MLVYFPGFGEDFTKSILGRWGDQPYTDIMNATDRLIERGLVDKKRMAITGGSYGSFATDRPSCASVSVVVVALLISIISWLAR